MSQTPTATTSTSNYQVIFDSALEAYKKKTKKDLRSHPLLPKLQTCNSPDAVLAVLREQIPVFDQSHGTSSTSDRLTKWLNPTVNVLYAFSEAIGAGISLVYPPAGVIFTGIGVLLSAAEAVSSSQDALVNVFGRIETFFRRLETYVQVPPSAGMTDMIIKIMTEVLSILAIATREFSQSRAKKYLKKVIGRTDIEDALARLDQLTQEEARMAAAQCLKATHVVHDGVISVDNHVQQVDDRVQGVGSDVQQVGIHVQRVDDKVQDVGSDVRQVDIRVEQVDGKVEGVSSDVQQVDIHVQQVDDKVQGVDDKVQQVADNIGDQKRDQLRKDLRNWLSPPDPSVNYNTASDARHEGTALWFIACDAFKDWKMSNSLLWIYGKPGSGKSVLSSSIIQDLDCVVSAGSVYVAYFFFDFKDTGKQDAHALLSSLLIQLSHQSASLCDILSVCYSTHLSGSRQPSDRALTQCLQDMIRFSAGVPIYLILDALDECPNTTGIPSSRDKVLELVEKLVNLNLPNLHLCITSRPEIDIRTSLEPLTSNRVSLHDQSGQKKDIVDYVNSVVYSDKNMRRWREEDKNVVIDVLSDRADGMFRWVYCQLETLRHCLPASVRRILAELPETLDATYERILQEIPKSNQVHAHRLLQCLTVAVRPLRVEELAEILAVDFDTSEGIPKLNEALRWEDQEQAVLSACSSLIAVIKDEDSRVVQFSHFSVKEFLTSDRLAMSKMDASLYHHIPLEPAHTIMAQACLGVLLRLDPHTDEGNTGDFPLAWYAVEHFGDHAEFENVLSHIWDGVDDLLDAEKSHFAVWFRIYRDRNWGDWTDEPPAVTPLYYVSRRGYRGLVDYLISKRPEDMNVRGYYGTPLHAALREGHADVAQLLLRHCVEDVDIRGREDRTPLHLAAGHGLLGVTRTLVERNADINSRDGSGDTPLHRTMDDWHSQFERTQDCRLDVVKFLLEHGADPDAKNDRHLTPLHAASYYGSLEGAQLMLEHGANIHARSKTGQTPLHRVLDHLTDTSYALDIFLDIVRCLLARGADVDALDDDRGTPLHLASRDGCVTGARVLLEHGANVHLEDKKGRTPFQVASEEGETDITQLLSAFAESAKHVTLL